jgi:hypothetical protein
MISENPCLHKTQANTACTGQKRGGSPLLGGIHTTGFFGPLAFIRQCPLLPVKPAVRKTRGFFSAIGILKFGLANYLVLQMVEFIGLGSVG